MAMRAHPERVAILVRIHRDVSEALKEAASKRDMSVAALVRSIIGKWKEENVGHRKDSESR
jgi:hypothetical protein